MAFYSRQLRPAETRYTVTEIECLVAVEAIRHFQVYLDGRKFVLQIDHSALLTAKLTHKRLMRWALQLQGLDFTIKYRKGSLNGNADGLSRQAWTFPKEPEDEEKEEKDKVKTRERSLQVPRAAPVLEGGGCGTIHRPTHIELRCARTHSHPIVDCR